MTSPAERRKHTSYKKVRAKNLRKYIKEAKKLSGKEREDAVQYILKHYCKNKREKAAFKRSGLGTSK